MSPSNGLFSSPVDSGWLVLLAEATLKGTLVLVIALALNFALRNARASTRHLVWSLALVGMIAVPILSFVVPHWTLPLFPSPVGAATPITANGVAPRLPAPDASSPLNATVPSRAVAESPREASVNTVSAAVTDMSVRSRSAVLAEIWLAGFFICLLAIMFSVAGLRVLARRAARIDDPSWLELLASLKRELGLGREVLLLRSQHPSMPATWGVSRPVILLPSEASEWTEERKRVVLLHELAHVKRYDCLTQLAAQICCALYWFHPGVWYVARRMRTERELACDEQVLTLGVNACDYADHLLDIARAFRAPVSTRMAAVAMARPSQLEGRLLAILNGQVEGRGAARTASRALVMGVLVVVILPLAAMRPWRDAPTVTPTSLAQGISLLQETDPPRPGPIVAVGDTFRWKARAFQGQWISIHANLGEISAVLTDGNEVEVIAVKRTSGRPDEALRMHVDTRRKGFDVCVLPVSSVAKKCEDAMGSSGQDRLARVDFLVRVPSGVGFGGHTGTGNVAAENLQSYAWATTGRGDISLETTGLAEASTRSGSISASFGRANWTGDLEFETGDGDVTVVAPANSSAMVQVETNRGTIKSDFPLSPASSPAGDYRRGRIGAGKAMLTLRTGSGDVELKRGPNGVIVRDAEASGSGSGSGSGFGYGVGSTLDPKPNPNPNPNPELDLNPAPDPDPNPNPDFAWDGSPSQSRGESPRRGDNPNPYSLPSWRGPASGDLDITSDDPTGERVPFTPPADLANRVSDARIASAVDRAAIIRLRDIAVTHRKQHAADFVKDRSVWALSQVSGGRLIQPLIGAVSSGDWRVRAYAAWALAATGEPSVVPALTAAMNDSHYRVRMHAVYGLERGGAAAVLTLIRALRDSHWQVRVGAVDALTIIDDERAVGPLRAMRQDQHPLVREEVAQALGKLER